MSENQYKISVVIPLYNKSELTKSCLESLIENSKIPLEIILVDNASSDDTQKVVEILRPVMEGLKWKVTLLSNDQNVGFGRAMNQGARVATSEYLALINNDIWVMPGWDEKLITEIERLSADMVSPYYYEKEFVSKEIILSLADDFINKNINKQRRFWGSKN